MSTDSSSRTAISRRRFLEFSQTGIGSTALMSMLADDHPVVGSGTPPHTAPRARRVIHIVATGGFSQVDSFDYKPQLARLHGTPLKSDEKPTCFSARLACFARVTGRFANAATADYGSPSGSLILPEWPTN